MILVYLFLEIYFLAQKGLVWQGLSPVAGLLPAYFSKQEK
jgi:hypothetical protein